MTILVRRFDLGGVDVSLEINDYVREVEQDYMSVDVIAVSIDRHPPYQNDRKGYTEYPDPDLVVVFKLGPRKAWAQ